MQVDRKGSVSIGRRGFIKVAAFTAAAAALEPSLNSPDTSPELESVGPFRSKEMKYFTFNQFVPHFLISINPDLLQEQSSAFGFPLGTSSSLAISLFPEYTFKNCFVEEQPRISLRKPSPESTEIMIAEALFLKSAEAFQRRSPLTNLNEEYLSIMLTRSIVQGLFYTLLVEEKISFENERARFKKYSDFVVKNPEEPAEVYFASMKKLYVPLLDTQQA